MIRQSQTELFASSRQGIFVPSKFLAAQSSIERRNARTSHGCETPVTSRKDFMLNTRDMPHRRDTTVIPQPGDGRDIPQELILNTRHPTNLRPSRHPSDNFALYGRPSPEPETARTSHGALPRTGTIWAWISVISCVTIRSQILQRLTTTSGHGIEAAALSLLALRNFGADSHALLGAQHRSGAWSALPDIEPLSGFHTALAFWQFDRFRLHRSDVRPIADSNGYRNCGVLSLIGYGGGSSVCSTSKFVSIRRNPGGRGFLVP